MALCGASPDGILTRPDGTVEACLEVKARSFFKVAVAGDGGVCTLSGVCACWLRHCSCSSCIDTLSWHIEFTDYNRLFELTPLRAGFEYTFVPSVPPFSLDTLDVAYVLQVQFQLHATGAEFGYLVSWARSGLSVIKIPYSYELISACALVLQDVIINYLSPQEIPKIPQNFPSLPETLQHKVIEVHTQLGAVVRRCELLTLQGAELNLPLLRAFQIELLCLPASVGNHVR